jgi:hypothetical protein
VEKININEIADVFETGTELNIGIFPNKNIVKYGFSRINNELTLYLQVPDENINFIKNYVSKNKQVNFYKWSGKGMVSGDGIVKILETKEEKTNSLKYIVEQQTKMDKEYNFNKNEFEDLFIIKILVENMYKMY